MKFALYGFCLCLLFSCGEGKSPKTFKVEEASFQKFVNQKPLGEDPNLNLDKSIVNNDYPIEIALYQDNRFYYNLPNLGDGSGTWSYQNGSLVLKAKRSIFDMKIDVHSIDEGTNNLIIKFTDRFGPNTLNVEKQNI